MINFKQLREKAGKSSSGYDLYHKTFSGAMQHAYAFAKKKGYVVDKDDIDNKVATGPKKPSSGKTNSYILKTNKANRHAHIQVANLDNKRYELNMYIESVTQENVELEERFTPKEIKMAIGIASDKRYAGGNYSGAVRAIEKIKKGLSNHKQVAAVLKRQNESLDENRNLFKDYEELKKKGKSDSQAQDILLSMPQYKRYDSAKLGKLIGDALRKGTIRKKAPFKLAEEFKPHKMYDPKTGKEYDAKTQADHERMAKMGYTHEKPEVKEGLKNIKGKDGKVYSLDLDNQGRKVMVRTKNNFGDIATIPLKKATKIFEGLQMPRSQFDMLKKGDKLTIHFDSSIKKGHKVPMVIKSLSRSAKYNVDKINLVPQSGRGKYTLYSRQGKDATLAMGDMGTVMTRIEYPKGGVQKEEVELVLEAIDLMKVAKGFEQYARKIGYAPDKKDFMKIAGFLRDMGKNSNASKNDATFLKMKHFIDKMDTDPRDGVYQLFQKHGMIKMGRLVREEKEDINEDYAKDLDLAQKNMARLAKQETGQNKKDYMAVARALNQGNLGAVKKVIKGISTDEIKADILNVLVGYNDLIAKMYPKAVDAKGRLKTPMSVGKMIKEDAEELDENYRELARKGMGTETKNSVRVGLEMDFYEPKQGDKRFGVVTKVTNNGYMVKSMDRQDKGKIYSFAFHDRAKAKKLLSANHKPGCTSEAVSPAQQAAIAISKKEKGEEPKKENRAKFDALRHMGKRGKDSADIDIKATDDDRKAADKNIIVQLRRVADLPKGGQIEFKNGKKVNLKQNLAMAVLKKYEQLKRADDKLKFQNMAGQSPQDLQKALKLR